MNRPVICALGVSHRDLELATHWVRWVTFLAEKHGQEFELVICLTLRASAAAEKLMGAVIDAKYRSPLRVSTWENPDEDETGYPRSASHLFLRTLEACESYSPKQAVLWCEADTVPMRPSWFAEIVAEYQTCGKPFMGARVGTRAPHLSGPAVYPHNWRKLMPSLKSVLTAPDMPGGKGQPWDTWCAKDTGPLMAESKLFYQVWKNRDLQQTRLRDIPAACALFHQDKTGALSREIASAHFPDFMDTLGTTRRFYEFNGHPSRLKARGHEIAFSFKRFQNHGWICAVCDSEVSAADANALEILNGKFGLKEISQERFLSLTGRKANSLKERAPSGPQLTNVSHPQVFVMLGRYGDIMNILPMLKAEADAGRRPSLVVAKDFADIIDGVTYVDRIVWDGAYDQLEGALRWLRRDKGVHAPVIAQCHRHPTDKGRLTDSYQKECWRLAGRLDDFEDRGPLVFDNRNPAREQALFGARVSKKPLILLGFTSHSSPLPAETIRAVAHEILSNSAWEVFFMENVRAGKIYELLALFDQAACLVTADTSFLHLSRASTVQTVALINDGWRGSVADHAPVAIRYAEITPQKVVDGIRECLALKPRSEERSLIEVPRVTQKPEANEPTVYHVVHMHGRDERHKVAQATWGDAYAEGMIPVHCFDYVRDAHSEIADPRRLPYFKDLLKIAIERSTNDRDIIVWTNSDIGFAPGFVAAIQQHVGQHGATSMRRTESSGAHHMGRDLFAFRVDWLRARWEEFPDYILGAPVFDTGLAAMIRKSMGLPTTTKHNQSQDFPPADMPPGYALHQTHRSEWMVRNMNQVPSIAHNYRLFWLWAQKYAPEHKFSRGKALL